jgi:hypothetical protein
MPPRPTLVIGSKMRDWLADAATEAIAVLHEQTTP